MVCIAIFRLYSLYSISMPSYKEGNMACKSSCTLDLPWDTEPGSAPLCQGRESCCVQMANPCVTTLQHCREHYLWAAAKKEYKKTRDTNRLPKNLLKATVFHRSFLPRFPSFGSPHASPILRQTKHLWQLPSKSCLHPDLLYFKWPSLTSLIAPFHHTVKVWW